MEINPEYEYHVGYDDYKTENGEIKFFTVICNTFDRLDLKI